MGASCPPKEAAITTLIADERTRQIFIARGYSDRDDIDSMSSGSMSPDLSDTWHQGLPMSPQWKGGLRLDFDNDCEDETDHEVDGRYDEIDSAAEKGAKDYISEVRESSIWISLRYCSGRCSGHAYGWTEVDPRAVVWEICRLVVLSHDKKRQ